MSLWLERDVFQLKDKTKEIQRQLGDAIELIQKLHNKIEDLKTDYENKIQKLEDRIVYLEIDVKDLESKINND